MVPERQRLQQHVQLLPVNLLHGRPQPLGSRLADPPRHQRLDKHLPATALLALGEGGQDVRLLVLADAVLGEDGQEQGRVVQADGQVVLVVVDEPRERAEDLPRGEDDFRVSQQAS